MKRKNVIKIELLALFVYLLILGVIVVLLLRFEKNAEKKYARIKISHLQKKTDKYVVFLLVKNNKKNLTVHVKNVN